MEKSSKISLTTKKYVTERKLKKDSYMHLKPIRQSEKLQKKQCGGVYIELYSITF